MPLDKPTRKEIRDRMLKDVFSLVTFGKGLFKKATLAILTKTNAGENFLIWTFISRLAKQFFINTADDIEHIGFHGDMWNIKQKLGTRSAGKVTATGQAGAIINQGTLLTNNDGFEYTTLFNATFIGTTLDVDIQAVEIGKVGNLVQGDPLSFVTVPTNVNEDVVVNVDDIVGGADLEDVDAWRARILGRIQNPTEIGRETDYIRWALDFPGLLITRVFIISTPANPNVVDVYFVLDGQAPASIEPNPTQIQLLDDYLETKKPITTIVNALSPTLKEIGITMNLTPNTVEVQNNVKLSLENHFTNNVTIAEVLIRSQLDEAISLATGETDHLITKLFVDTVEVPVADIPFGNNELPVLGPLLFN